MSDPTMELIRGANPCPDELPPLPIESVMQRLDDDESPEPAGRRRIPGIGGLMVVVSVVAALAVAVLAITSLSDRRQTPVTGGSSVTSSHQELLQTIGVLRRPQSKADLIASRPGGQGGELPGIFRVASLPLCRPNTNALPCTLRLDKSLVRAVNLGDGYRAAIFPAKVERSTPQAHRGEGVVVALRGPGLYIITSMTPTSTQSVRDHGLLLSAYVARGVDRGVMLVPDGVAQVTLDHFHLLAPRNASLGQVTPITAAVTDNFAPLQITGLTEHNLHLNPHTLGRYNTQGSGFRCRITFAVYSLPATAQMTWFTAAHTEIRRETINLRLDIGTHHPAPGTTEPSPACPR